jgi:hypothetical protein
MCVWYSRFEIKTENINFESKIFKFNHVCIRISLSDLYVNLYVHIVGGV